MWLSQTDAFCFFKCKTETIRLAYRLTLHSVHRSSLQERFPVTMILAFSQGRLVQMVENICKTWEGPILATVHLPLVASRATAAEIANAKAHSISKLVEKWALLLISCPETVWNDTIQWASFRKSVLYQTSLEHCVTVHCVSVYQSSIRPLH